MTIYKGAEVIENYRKRGINTQMMQHWLNEAKEYKCNWAVFQTDSSNFGSINTGKKFSFNMEFAKECYCKKLFNFTNITKLICKNFVRNQAKSSHILTNGPPKMYMI